MHIAIWEYDVRNGAEREFEALYGADGAWVRLFAQYAGYLGTELLRDAGSGRYLTIDRWHSAEAYAAFLGAARESYASLDAAGDALTVAERCIGRYTSC